MPETTIQPKFKAGDRVLQDFNNPKWPEEDRTAVLISHGTVIEYRIIPGTTEPLVPFVQWDKGAPGFSAEEHLQPSDKPAPILPEEESGSKIIDVKAVSVSPGLTRLAQLEGEIESARNQLQRAVFEIKEDRLWEEKGYDNFAHYCKERWGWEKSNAYEMAIAGRTINQLLDSGVPENEIPESTSALSEIAQASPEQRPSVLQETQARDGNITAIGVKKTLRHTQLVKALWGQLGEISAPFTAIYPEKFEVSGPLFDKPVWFLTVKDAQQAWELDGQRLCAKALNNHPPNRQAKAGLQRVPCRIVSSGRNDDIGKRAWIMGDWSPDAMDAAGNTPRSWDYPFLVDGNPVLRSLHLFQVKIEWENTHDWQPTTAAPSPAPSPAPSAAPATTTSQPRLEVYAPGDQRGQEKSAIARNVPALAPFPTGPYSLIVADPPWQYTLRETDASHRGRTPYPTMSDEKILNLPMADLAADNAYILLWATNAHLPLAFDCLALWGFEYKAIHTWIKQNGESGKTQMGLGHYGRNCTEHYLVGVKGKPGAWSTLGLTDIATVIFEGRKEHSKKPTQFWAIAQALKVKLNGEAIELFARGDRTEWDTWGLEA